MDGQWEVVYASIDVEDKFTLFDANDPYYYRTFDSIDEYVAFLQNLLDAGNKFFETDCQITKGKS